MAKAKKRPKTSKKPVKPKKKPVRKKPMQKSAPKKTTKRKPLKKKSVKKTIKKPTKKISPPSALKKKQKPKPFATPPLYPKRPEPIPKPAPGLSKELTINLDLLPPWEDRLRLRRTIFEEGLKFFMAGKNSEEQKEAKELLSHCSKNPSDQKPGHYMVCVKDKSGKIVGAMDGHALDNNIVSICRSYVKDRKTRDMHILLYAAALTGRAAKHVVCS